MLARLWSLLWYDDEPLSIEPDSMAGVMGYYERINRRALHVDSSAATARKCALLLDHAKHGVVSMHVEIGVPKLEA